MLFSKGGTKTGETVILNSAKHFKKFSLELGGKNPNIIFEDANLQECVATTVRSSFLNQGEICLCGSRIFVQDTIYEKFIEAFVEQAKTFKVVELFSSLCCAYNSSQVGDPFNPETKVGALITKEHREKVEYYVQLAQEEGIFIFISFLLNTNLRNST